mmetsp:Transcript_2460/g.2091  ORF Transcript_2460/g.2091 Transcript_2460/m.2091 type:complete len:193 (+) Transcript_2460:1411-1989(+)
MDASEILEFAKGCKPKKRNKIIQILSSEEYAHVGSERERAPFDDDEDEEPEEPNHNDEFIEYSYPQHDAVKKLINSVPKPSFAAAKKKVEQEKKYLLFTPSYFGGENIFGTLTDPLQGSAFGAPPSFGDVQNQRSGNNSGKSSKKKIKKKQNKQKKKQEAKQKQQESEPSQIAQTKTGNEESKQAAAPNKGA